MNLAEWLSFRAYCNNPGSKGEPEGQQCRWELWMEMEQLDAKEMYWVGFSGLEGK